MIKRLSVEWIIGSAVLEFLLEAAADFDSQLWSNGYITFIKKPMHIAAQQKPIEDFIGAAFGKRFDMGSFKNRKSVLLCDCAGAAVGISHKNSE